MDEDDSYFFMIEDIPSITQQSRSYTDEVWRWIRNDTMNDTKLRAARERAQQELEVKAAEVRQRQVPSETPLACTDPHDFVTTLINSTPVVVFSKTYCPYCRTAKRALSTYRLPSDFYKIIELDEREDCDKILDVLLKMTKARTVPRVFINGKCVGGCDDTLAAQKNGSLDKMLKEAGVI
ncbi:unnamed protein product [Thelazia callipaeda]|uniref:Glutaredoxin domain-containing protein n=1 Tax=Thelazia callipaeda TaxID=103827 RepID=A0A0N5DB98_THECL|nr:unnamed protein product [Thelazia callipaeda]